MSKNNQSSFIPVPSKQKRSTAKPTGIIINQTTDFGVVDTSIEFDSYKLEQPYFTKLAREKYDFKTDFSHIYIELVNYFYISINSLGLMDSSPVLLDMVSKGLIPEEHRNSILISIVGNYSEQFGDIPEKNLYIVMGYNIANILRIFNLSINRVHYLSDLFDYERYLLLNKNKRLYDVKDMNKIDRSDVESFTRRYLG
jgi:hypothetical protein